MDKEKKNLGPLIFALKESNLFCEGCIEYWCHAIHIQEKEKKAKDIPIVCEFRDVFIEELTGLPLNEKLIMRLN